MFNSIYRFFYPAKNPDEIRRFYGVPEKIDFNFELQPDGWMVLTSDQLPGLITEGRNPQELLKMFNDAVLTYFDVPKKYADFVFPAIHLSGLGNVSYKNAHSRCLA
jgi:hypothetical protein